MTADFFGGAHRVERACDDLRGARPMTVVGRLRFEQLRVGEDDPELIVQAVKEETELRRFIHRSPRQQLVNAQPRHQA